MKIICIGRNYSEHIKELGNDPNAEPVFFMKPDTALLPNRNHPVFYPDFTSNLHYEGELVFRISRLGKFIEPQFAHLYIDAVGFGIDFTARDLQQECMAKGLPWEMAKSFDFSAPVDGFRPLSDFPDLNNISFELKLNGMTVQFGNSRDMIFDIRRIIGHVSKYVTLRTGDLIFTGTPKGVGPVQKGDILEGFLEGISSIKVQVK